MKTPEELSIDYKNYVKEYLDNIEKFQKQCKHEDISDWIIIRDPYLHYNDTGWRVKQCQICWKILSEKCGDDKPVNYTEQKLKYKNHWKGGLDELK